MMADGDLAFDVFFCSSILANRIWTQTERDDNQVMLVVKMRRYILSIFQRKILVHSQTRWLTFINNQTNLNETMVNLEQWSLQITIERTFQHSNVSDRGLTNSSAFFCLTQNYLIRTLHLIPKH